MNKINLILDIDETLIHTEEISNDLKNDENIIKLPYFTGKVYLRPYLEEFLNFCFENFTVSFWTTSNSLYCKTILQLILTKEQFDKTLLVLSSEENKIINLKTNLIYSDNKSQLKPLELLFEDKKLSKIFKKENTLIIDNTLNIIYENKYNSILVEDFRNNDNINVFCVLANLLNRIKSAGDVTKCKKTYSSESLYSDNLFD